MHTRAVPQATPTVIQQRITSGNFFDGSMPNADVTADLSNALYKYPAATTGGLFLWAGREPLIVSQLLVDLGGSGNITVKLVNINPTTYDADAPTLLAGEAITLEALTGVTQLRHMEADFKLSLLPFQGIQLITTTSAAAQIAQLTATVNRTRQW